MQIEMRGTVHGVSYREVIQNGEVVAAIWGIPDGQRRCFSVVMPSEEPPVIVPSLRAAERLVGIN